MALRSGTDFALRGSASLQQVLSAAPDAKPTETTTTVAPTGAWYQIGGGATIMGFQVWVVVAVCVGLALLCCCVCCCAYMFLHREKKEQNKAAAKVISDFESLAPKIPKEQLQKLNDDDFKQKCFKIYERADYTQTGKLTIGDLEKISVGACWGPSLREVDRFHDVFVRAKDTEITKEEFWKMMRYFEYKLPEAYRKRGGSSKRNLTGSSPPGSKKGGRR